MTVDINLERQIVCVKREVSMRQDIIAVPLYTGQDLLIEMRDLWVFTYWRWSVRQHRNTAYLQRKEGGLAIHFHRQVIGAGPDDLVVDHRNGNGLDNRRLNLRGATRRQNNWNRAGQRDATSGFHGVSFHPFSGLWRARLRVDDAAELTTYHATPEEAARARDAAAIEARGEFACLNFPTAEDEIETMQAVQATLEQLLAERRAQNTPELF